MLLLLVGGVAARESTRISAASASLSHRRLRASRSPPSCWHWRAPRHARAPGPIAVDNFRWATDIVILLGDDRRDRAEHGRQRARAASSSAESHVLLLLASSGMMLLAAARDLMIVFLGIELMSIASTCSPASTAAARGRPKARSSTSCSARSRRRSCSTASRSSTAPPARRTSTMIGTARHRSSTCRRARCCSSASRCCSSASASRSRRCRSTCGRRTSTTARRRRSPRTWRRR